MHSPRVSVVVPNYNHARFLPQRIESILKQSFADYELLLLDDASTDESREVLRRYAADARARVCFNEQNSGSTFAQWNRAAAMAKGEYIWFAESDDYAETHLLARLIDQLEKNPGCVVAYCQSREVDESGRVGRTFEWFTESLHPKRWSHDFVANGREELGCYLVERNTLPNASAVVIRKNAWEQVGGADPRMKLAGDWKLWVQLLAIGDLAFVSEPLNFFRQHGSSVRAQKMRTLLYVAERYEILAFILRNAEVPASLLTQCRDLLGDLWEVYAKEDPDSLQWHWRVYQQARQADPAIHQRIFNKTLRPWLGGVKNQLLRRRRYTV